MNQYTLFGSADQNLRAVTALEKPSRATAAVNEDYYQMDKGIKN